MKSLHAVVIHNYAQCSAVFIQRRGGGENVGTSEAFLLSLVIYFKRADIADIVASCIDHASSWSSMPVLPRADNVALNCYTLVEWQPSFHVYRKHPFGQPSFHDFHDFSVYIYGQHPFSC